jgi:hypothetical protein
MKVLDIYKEEIGEAVETDRYIIVVFKHMDAMYLIEKEHVEMPVSSAVIEKKNIVKKEKKVKRKYTRHVKSSMEKRKKLTYLSIKEDAKKGKSLNSSVALAVYKRYGVRLWNNVVADLQSRVNSARQDEVYSDWLVETVKGILQYYDVTFTDHQLWAHVMFLKGVGLIKSKRHGAGRGKKIAYVINRQPEIPKTIST